MYFLLSFFVVVKNFHFSFHFLIRRPSMMSDSEMEDDPNSHVEVPQKLPSRGNIVSQKSSIRLSELGPRLTLQVVTMLKSHKELD